MKTLVNRPLVNTFGWLHVNGTPVELPERPETLTVSLQSGEERILLAEGPLSLEAEVGSGGVLKLIQLRRGDEPGAQVSDIRGSGDEPDVLTSDVHGSGNGSAPQVSDVRVRCSEQGRFEWYRVVLGGSETYDNCSVTLEGEGSSFSAEIGFRLGGTEKLDVNCEAIHLGRRTESDIHASGVLSGEAFKLLRGTIDLRTGCSGAVGNESEDVLLLDETVRNQSVPVILCSEEDVVGNHGASIGRLDESLVFYLESRGMPRETVTEMMARARLDAVIRKLPDEALRRELLGEEESHELG